MAVLAFPAIEPDSFEFGIKYNTQVSVSSLDGSVKTVELPGARWKGRMSFNELTVTEARILIIFLLELRGMNGRFYMYDKTLPENTGSVTSIGTVEQTTGTTVIRATTVGGTLNAGDYMQIGSGTDRELKVIISKSQPLADPLQQDYVIEPKLRVSTANNYDTDPITISQGSAPFILTSDDQATWPTNNKAKLTNITIDFVETFLPSGF